MGAFIAGAVALVVAVVSLISTRHVAEIQASSSRDLETLKQYLKNAQRTQQIADDEFLSVLETLKKAVDAIQRFKDEIQLVLAAGQTSLTSREALERIRASRDCVLNVYAESASVLATEERANLHQAKNDVIYITTVLEEQTGHSEFVSMDETEARRALIELRAQLTERQNRLRDFRIERLADKLGLFQ